jgi:Ca2+-binding RTX toxin-like protein
MRLPLRLKGGRPRRDRTISRFFKAEMNRRLRRLAVEPLERRILLTTTPTISLLVSPVVEEGGTVQATVLLSQPSSRGVTVRLATANGTASAPADYKATSSLIWFPAGSTKHSVKIPTYADSLFERDETFTISLSQPIGATLGVPGSAAIIISDKLLVDIGFPGSSTSSSDSFDSGESLLCDPDPCEDPPPEDPPDENQPPVAVSDSYQTDVGASIGIDPLGNDTDPDGDTLSMSVLSGPNSGSLSTDENGALIYVPGDLFRGWDGFNYAASDGNLSSSAGVSILVDTPPSAADDSATVDEDSEIAISVLGNDSDPDGDTLSVTVTTQPQYGSLTDDGNGGFIYTPNPNFHGTDGFSYEISDGYLTAAAGVTIVVHTINDAPVALGESYSTDEDNSLVVSAPGLLGNDSDVDNLQLTASLADPPMHGAVALNADGAFIYTPAENFYGPDSFSYHAGDGAATSAPAVVTIEVAPIDDPPVAQNSTYKTFRNTALTEPAPGVLGNDFDPDGDQLTAILVANAAHGLATLNSDGSFTYAPAAHFTGEDSFTYRATDGQFQSNIVPVYINVYDPDVEITSFYSDGTRLKIDYYVAAQLAEPLEIALYASPDGVELQDLLHSGIVEGTDGPHPLTIEPNFTDLRTDYYLVAKIDSANDLLEENEDNNRATFTGGTFLASETASGRTILHVHAGNDSELTTVFAATSGPLHVRTGQPASRPLPQSPTAPPPYYDFVGDGIVSQLDVDALALSRTSRPKSWQNPANRFDVNNDGYVIAQDALYIINYVNANGSQLLTQPHQPGYYYFDVTGDHAVTNLDSQQVLDYLNGNSGNATTPWRNGANPLDIDGDGEPEADDDDEIAILDYLYAQEGGATSFDAAAIDEVHIRTHRGNDHAFARTTTAPIPFWLFGGEGSDTLSGTANNDYMDGGLNNDVLEGNAGADQLLGGLHDDTVSGGAGNDHISGGSQNDNLAGDEGDDTIFGEDGNDTASGGEGDDIITGGNGNDTLTGDAGNDYLGAGAGTDSLSGGDGNDELYGSSTDSLNGGSGTNGSHSEENWQPVEVGFSVVRQGFFEGNSDEIAAGRGLGGNQAVTVIIAVESGSAIYGQDFGGPSTYTVTIPESALQSPSFTVPLRHDIDVEPTEDYWLRIIDVQGGYSPPGLDLLKLYINDVRILIDSADTLPVNDDDDNEDQLPDFEQPNVVGDDELHPVVISLPEFSNVDMRDYKVEITFNGPIALWSSASKEAPISNSDRLPAAAVLPWLYIEGGLAAR